MQEISFKGKNYSNPVSVSLDIIGGKWKIPIIWNLRNESLRYGELKKSLQKINHKMLTQQLRELVESEIIVRKVHSHVPPKVEYSLTLLGKSVLPVIEMLNEWGNEYKKLFE